MTMARKRKTPDRDELVRALTEIRADLAELRRTFERVRDRMDAAAKRGTGSA
jgi:hypothetical protein